MLKNDHRVIEIQHQSSCNSITCNKITLFVFFHLPQSPSNFAPIRPYWKQVNSGVNFLPVSIRGVAEREKRGRGPSDHYFLAPALNTLNITHVTLTSHFFALDFWVSPAYSRSSPRRHSRPRSACGKIPA